MIKQAYFAAGCFWGVEAAFQELEGVTRTSVGYAGGHLDEPSYADVCSETSGHAETVCVEYDPCKISYQALLDTFFNLHDPTEEGQNCSDFGSQYRSIIFFIDEDEKTLALKTIAQLDKEARFDSPICTEIVSMPVFWPAEDYHQQYYARHGLLKPL